MTGHDQRRLLEAVAAKWSAQAGRLRRQAGVLRREASRLPVESARRWDLLEEAQAREADALRLEHGAQAIQAIRRA